MRNFIPTLICLIALFFVAVKDTTYNVAPPYSWYDVIGCLVVVFLIVSFVWGMVQQSNDNDVRRVRERQQKISLHSGLQTTPPALRSNSVKPLDPPKRK